MFTSARESFLKLQGDLSVPSSPSATARRKSSSRSASLNEPDDEPLSDSVRG